MSHIRILLDIVEIETYMVFVKKLSFTEAS